MARHGSFGSRMSESWGPAVTPHCHPAMTKVTTHIYTNKERPPKGKGANEARKHPMGTAVLQAWGPLLQHTLPDLRVFREPVTHSLNPHRLKANQKRKLQHYQAVSVDRKTAGPCLSGPAPGFRAVPTRGWVGLCRALWALRGACCLRLPAVTSADMKVIFMCIFSPGCFNK